MLGMFQRIDKDLYQKLLKKNESEFFHYLADTDREVLDRKSTTIMKALKKKKWTVTHLTKHAVKEVILEATKENKAIINYV